MNGAATIPVRTAFRLIHCSGPWGYKAIADGSFPLPVISIGRKLVVAKAKARDLLGLTDDELESLLAEVPS